MAIHNNEYTSASDLAQMAVCERQVLLRAKMGDRKTARQEAAARHGEVVHMRIHSEGHAPLHTCKPTDKRCFIATAVYGADSPETVRLRRFRDEVLLCNPLGKYFVAIYYRISPSIAGRLDRNHRVRALVKWVLDILMRVMQ